MGLAVSLCLLSESRSSTSSLLRFISPGSQHHAQKPYHLGFLHDHYCHAAGCRLSARDDRLAQALFHAKANGQLITRNGLVIGSRIIGQPFSGSGYFYSRPSAAGSNGYDATSSGGSNYGPTNKKYIDRIESDVVTLQKQYPGVPVPIDLVPALSGVQPRASCSGCGIVDSVSVWNRGFFNVAHSRRPREETANHRPSGRSSCCCPRHGMATLNAISWPCRW